MGAEGTNANEDLLFKIRLEVDTKNPIPDWGTHEKAIQDLINSKPFNIKLNVDTTAVLAAVNAVNALNTSMYGVSGGKQSTPAQMVVAQAKADKIALDAKTASIVKMMAAEADAAKKALDLEAAEKRLAAATKQSEVADISKEVALKKKASAEANAIVAENQRIASIQRVSASVLNSITADNNKEASIHRVIAAENGKIASASRVISAMHGETTAENSKISSANRVITTANGVVISDNKRLQSQQTLISSTNRAAQSTLNLERAQQRGIAATHTQNQAYQNQKGIMNGLPQMMNSYISILGMYRFVNNIKDITGEFELQKVALGAIIQDADKANMLFEQIKTKAVESPFMVKDMVTYTKQLAAFKVETESLFGTMNMLADISAGLGVGMDRLILAYGQVKAASVLRGQELRQFTEAGIPLVQLLADKFTQLNGVATTTGDVFNLIRKRGVSFEMVDQIFKDMTASGGTFFNMQEIQAKTLKGIWMNLTDQLQITMDEMGRANRGVLSETGLALRELAKNWRIVLAVSSPIATAFIAYNTIMFVSGVRTAFLAKSELLLARAVILQTAAVEASTAGNMANAVALGTEAVATGVAAGATNIFTRALAMLRIAMLTNPVTFWVAAIGTAVATIWGIVDAISSFETKASRMNKELSESTIRIKSSADLTVYSLEALFGKLAESTESSQEYYDIIDQISKKTDTYIDGTMGMASAQDAARKAIDATTVAIKSQAKEKAREAGMQIIEGKFADTSVKAYENIRKGLTSQKAFTQAQADIIAQQIADAVAANPAMNTSGKTMLDGVMKLIEKMQKEWGSGNSMKISIPSFMSGVAELSTALTGTDEAIVRLNKDLDLSFSTTTNETLAVKSVTAAYALSIKNMKSAPSALGETALATSNATKEFAAHKKELESLLDVYRQFGNFKAFERTSRELENLTAKGQGWETAIDRMTKKPEGAAVLAYGSLGAGSQKFTRTTGDDAESIVEYYDRMQKEYTDVLETQAKVSKGLKMSDTDKAALLKDAKDLQAIGKVLGTPLEGLKADPKKTNPRIAALSSQLSLIEEAYKKYLERMKQIGAEAAKAEITTMYGDQNKDAGKASGIALPLAFSSADMGKNLDIASKASFNTIEVKTKLLIKKQDTSYDETAAALKTKMEETAAKIDQYQKANDFYDKAFAWTGDDSAAKELVRKMGFTFGNIREQLQSQLRETMGLGKDANMSDMGALQGLISGMSVPDAKKQAQDQFNVLQEYNLKTLDALNSSTDKYQDDRDKRLQIEKDYQDRLRVIDAANLTPGQRQSEIGNANRTRTGSLADLQYEDLKNMTKYAMAFEDMDRVGSATLTALAADFQKMIDTGKLSAPMLMMVGSQLKKIKAVAEKDSPFISLKHGIDLYTTAIRNMENGTGKSLMDDQNSAKEGFDMIVDSIKNMDSALQTLAAPINDSIALAEKLGEDFGFTFSDETQSAIDGFKAGMELMSGAIAIVNSALAVSKMLKAWEAAANILVGTTAAGSVPGIAAMGAALWAALAPVLAIIAPILAVVAVIAALAIGISYLVNKNYNDGMKKRADAILNLADALEKLKREQDKVVGTEYVQNMKAQIANEQQQADTELANMEANEKRNTKKKKAAYDAAKKAYQDHLNNIEDLQAAFLKEMAGTDLASAAKDFASAWLDAYNSFGNTMDAMGAKFKEMINTLVTNAVLSAVVMAKLKPVFDAIEIMFSADSPGHESATAEEIANLQSLMNGILPGLDADLRGVMGGLTKAGVDTKPSATPALTGISKSVSTASEDSINTMGGYLNSNLMQLVQQTKLQQNLVVIGEKQGGTLTDLYNLQNAALSQLQAINSNTSRNAIAAEELVSKVGKLMTPGNGQTLSVKLY